MDVSNVAAFEDTLKTAVHDAEATLGRADYSVNERNRRFARSLYVCKDMKAGERFTPENVRSVRPSNGLHPKYYDAVIGKTAARDLPFGTPLTPQTVTGGCQS